jgi:hypothetical protein
MIATHVSALDHAFLAGVAQRAGMSLQGDLAKLVPAGCHRPLYR